MQNGGRLIPLVAWEARPRPGLGKYSLAEISF